MATQVPDESRDFQASSNSVWGCMFGVPNSTCYRTMPGDFTEIEESRTSEVNWEFVDPDVDNFIELILHLLSCRNSNHSLYSLHLIHASRDQ